MNNRQKQRGVVLIMSIVFLFGATLLAIALMQSTIFNEKANSNFKKSASAFSAAEAALLEAERFIDATTLSSTDFSTACTNGLCRVNATNPIWSRSSTNWTKAKQITATIDFGKYSVGTVCSVPCYLIEELPVTSTNTSSLVIGASYMPPPPSSLFRITARALEQSSTTSAASKNLAEIVLQTVYEK